MLMNTWCWLNWLLLWTIQANYVDDFDVVAWLEHHLKWLNSTIIESQTSPTSSSTTTTYAAVKARPRECYPFFCFLLLSHGWSISLIFVFCYIHFTSSLSFVCGCIVFKDTANLLSSAWHTTAFNTLSTTENVTSNKQ